MNLNALKIYSRVTIVIPKNTSVGYQDLIHVFTELARCVQNNKTQCATVFSKAKVWIDFYGRGINFSLSQKEYGLH